MISRVVAATIEFISYDNYCMCAEADISTMKDVDPVAHTFDQMRNDAGGGDEIDLESFTAYLQVGFDNPVTRIRVHVD